MYIITIIKAKIIWGGARSYMADRKAQVTEEKNPQLISFQF